MTIFKDDFNRPNQNLDVSPNWTHYGINTGSIVVENNKLSTTINIRNIYTGPDLGSADHYAECEVTNDLLNVIPLLVVRATDSNNFIGLYYFIGNYRIIQFYNSNTVVFDTFSGSISNGNIIRLEVVGNYITFYKNGVIQRTAYTNNGLTETHSGVWSIIAPASQYIDNFKSGSIYKKQINLDSKINRKEDKILSK